RNVDTRQLVEWGLHAVVVHRDAGEHRRCRSSGPYRGKVVLGNRHGLFHFVLGIEESVVDHGHSLILRESSGGRWSTYECPDPLTAHSTRNVALREEVEHQDRHVVVHTQAESGRIGDSQTPLQNLTVRDDVEHFRARIAVRVSGEHTVDRLRHQHRLTTELEGTLRGRGIRREVRHAHTGPENHDTPLLQMSLRPAGNVGFGHLAHGDGALYPGRHTFFLQEVLQRETVHHRTQHGHVVGTVTVHPPLREFRAPEEVAPAD